MITQRIRLDHTTNFSTNAIGYCVVGDDRQCSTTTANHLDDKDVTTSLDHDDGEQLEGDDQLSTSLDKY